MNSKPLLPCCFAETIGTFFLVLFGCGSVHNAVLLGDLQGLWQVAIVWGIAIALTIYTVGPVSGAHINPAVTIGLAVWNKFSWARVFPYLVSQMLGAILAAAVLYSIFSPYIEQKEFELGLSRGKPESIITASMYGEYYPNPGGLDAELAKNPSQLDAFFSLVPLRTAVILEIIGTAILMMVILAVTNSKSTAWPQFMAPALIGLTVTLLICLIAPITQGCFNPARDLGPRVFAYFAGWKEIAIPGPRPYGWWAVYLVSPIIGSIGGAGLYLKFIAPWSEAEASTDSEPEITS